MATFRTATQNDLPSIVRLLAEDPLGASRETMIEPLPDAYLRSFEAIAAQPGNEIIVGDEGGAVIACLQLTMVPGLSRKGATRAILEGVRVSSGRRGQGIGEAMVRYAIEKSRAAGCSLVQLTTDKSRVDAHRFYENLGFVASHVGMKLDLT
jgi:GNAT superfamily N-acetyltransferase